MQLNLTMYYAIKTYGGVEIQLHALSSALDAGVKEIQLPTL
jgi:hypothetical protein